MWIRDHDRSRLVSILWMLCALLWGAIPALAKPDVEALPDIQIVVAASNPNSELTCKKIGYFFLRKSLSWRWGDETLGVQPVDQVWGSEVHQAFARRILGKSASAIKSFWQNKIVCHRPPPPEQLEDDAAVLRYVAREAGAIGYVTAGIDLGEEVKALTISSVCSVP